MKPLLLAAFILLGFIPSALADHITGGEIFYTFKGMSGSDYRYGVTVRLFMRCNSERMFNDPAIIGVFNLLTGERITNLDAALTRTQQLSLDETDPCITNPPRVCYNVGSYEFDVVLPPSKDGYLLTAQVVYRIDGINNLTANYNQVGATYTGVIPASDPVSNGPANNSAKFTGSDLVVVCAGNKFTYSFGAIDDDGDKLRYSFCEAYQTSGLSPGNTSVPPPPPPYHSVPYGNGYTGSVPLGQHVQIDPSTGLITGIAPSPGVYVITVCVEEIRNGVVIATQRKDLQVNIASCGIAAAALPPEYLLCDNSMTLTATNLSTSPLIHSFNWEFFDNRGRPVFSSAEKTVTHTFTDTGTYEIRLVINEGQQCSDSISSVARVYPGFVPDFDVSGSCISNPVAFTDHTRPGYGEVNSWAWDFGEPSSANNSSAEQSPAFQYRTPGNKLVKLVATNTLGCRDTLQRTATIFDKPPIELAFRDTLICQPDALQLTALGNGSFSWTPAAQIQQAQTAQPTVSPLQTTIYYVDLNLDGCLNRDSVTVHVVDHVDLEAMPDTVICLGDPLTLHIESNGLRFAWTPASSLGEDHVKTPLAVPEGNTVYAVTASISSCQATENVVVSTVPYPAADAGPDTLICFDSPAFLHASTDGSTYNWSPDPAIASARSLATMVRPRSSSSYIFFAYDTRGCPKPGIDTMNVTVLEEIVPFAGRDTTAVVGQPLQLNATGGTRYNWSPAIALSDTAVADPIAIFSSAAPEAYRYWVRISNAAGCMDSASVQVKVFATGPDIFVPSAFTPNNDGRNDLFQPVAAGVRSIDLFDVYNRWGQLVYRTTNLHSLGWDGTYKGELLTAGTFVWVLRATDFTGVPFVKKGTVVLIR